MGSVGPHRRQQYSTALVLCSLLWCCLPLSLTLPWPGLAFLVDGTWAWGFGMQVLNYAEPNFCKIFRDLDLVAVQFAGLSCGASQLVNHVLHKCVCHLCSRSSLAKKRRLQRECLSVGVVLLFVVGVSRGSGGLRGQRF